MGGGAAQRLCLLLDKLRAAGPHEVLGVAPDAGPQEVRTAFLEATKRFHPNRFARETADVRETVNELFLLVRRAYEQLRTGRAGAVAAAAPPHATPAVPTGRTQTQPMIPVRPAATTQPPQATRLASSPAVPATTPPPATRLASSPAVPATQPPQATWPASSPAVQATTPPPATRLASSPAVQATTQPPATRLASSPAVPATQPPRAVSAPAASAPSRTVGAEHARTAATATRTRPGIPAFVPHAGSGAEGAQPYAASHVPGGEAGAAPPCGARPFGTARPPIAPTATNTRPPAEVERLLEEVRTRGARFEAALLALAGGEVASAVSLLVKLVAEDPHAKRYRANLAYAQGLERRDAGDLDRAIRELERAVALDPECTGAASELARLQEQRRSGGFLSKLFGR